MLINVDRIHWWRLAGFLLVFISDSFFKYQNLVTVYSLFFLFYFRQTIKKGYSIFRVVTKQPGRRTCILSDKTTEQTMGKR